MMPNLKKLRLERNISQQALADAIFVSQQSINKYENHDVKPDFDTLARIADYFETTIDYLIGYTDFPQKFCDLTEYGITASEADLINNYRLLTREQKESINLIIKNYRSLS